MTMIDPFSVTYIYSWGLHISAGISSLDIDVPPLGLGVKAFNSQGARLATVVVDAD